VAANLLVIEGTVHRTPIKKQSPSGVGHIILSLEHQSTQVEAGLPRKAYVRIQVVLSGDVAQQYSQDLYQGCYISVSGFLSRHETKDGVGKLVLHAQKIERIQ
jgi:primosomal replication protein N